MLLGLLYTVGSVSCEVMTLKKELPWNNVLLLSDIDTQESRQWVPMCREIHICIRNERNLTSMLGLSFLWLQRRFWAIWRVFVVTCPVLDKRETKVESSFQSHPRPNFNTIPRLWGSVWDTLETQQPGSTYSLFQARRKRAGGGWGWEPERDWAEMGQSLVTNS